MLSIPAKFIGTNVAIYVGAIATVLLFIYEYQKKDQLTDFADGWVNSTGQGGHYTNFSLRALIYAALLCYGSFYMCKEGSEDLLIEITDKTSVIKDDGSSRKKAIKGEYAASLKRPPICLMPKFKELKPTKQST